MQKPPFDVRMELVGWDLLWAEVEISGGAEEELATLRRRVVERARERLTLESLSTNPVIKAIRRFLFARGGLASTTSRFGVRSVSRGSRFCAAPTVHSTAPSRETTR